MAGIYIHIPFCKQACHYCNFHFSTSLKLKNDFLTALLKEIALQQPYLQNETVHTIYFGGGTPSLLTPVELQQVLTVLQQHFSLNNPVEITLEANPDDITTEKLSAWRQAGINRLSIGVQSFFEEDLRWMNRAHNAGQAIHCIQQAQAAGFHNLTIDLIYGTPTLPDERWQQNVEQVLQLNIPHISCYALTVESKTVLDTMIQKQQLPPVNPEDQARQFLLLMDWLGTAGYEHYEISNFALPGHRSQHNSAYWQGHKYVGLGPSAHSFNGHTRQWNVANNALYIQSLLKNELLFEKETLTATQKLNEYIMTSLRTVEGLSLQQVRAMAGEVPVTTLRKKSARFLAQQLLREEDDRLILTKQGKLFADGMAADLFAD